MSAQGEAAPRIALVTGATSGLGRAVARALSAQGLRVLVHGRDPERTRELAAELDRTGAAGARPLVADLASLARVRELAVQAQELEGAVHVLVNNAGLGAGPPPHTLREVSGDGHELHGHPRGARGRDHALGAGRGGGSSGARAGHRSGGRRGHRRLLRQSAAVPRAPRGVRRRDPRPARRRHRRDAGALRPGARARTATRGGRRPTGVTAGRTHAQGPYEVRPLGCAGCAGCSAEARRVSPPRSRTRGCRCPRAASPWRRSSTGRARRRWCTG